jgi:protein-L-isoaspartate O-methyltransferase
VCGWHRLVVAAAFPEVPAPLVAQLAESGQLEQPIGLRRQRGRRPVQET